jgi:hypothetical protein
MPEQPMGLDDFAAVAAREPVFAGLHVGADGLVNILLVDTEREAAVVAAIADVFSSRPELSTLPRGGQGISVLLCRTLRLDT